MASSRRITLEDEQYRWLRRARGFRVADRVIEQDQVTVWVEGHAPAILQVQFTQPEPVEGYTQGFGWSSGFVIAGLREYNLNRPAMVAALIRAARARGWQPRGRRPLTIDGFALLREAPTEFPCERLHGAWLELATQLLEAEAGAAGEAPLVWLGERTDASWPWILRQPEHRPALIIAGLIEFGVLLVDVGDEARAELLVAADARQAAGLAGGVALTTWLLEGGAVDEELALDDLQAWCERLLGERVNAER